MARAGLEGSRQLQLLETKWAEDVLDRECQHD